MDVSADHCGSCVEKAWASGEHGAWKSCMPWFGGGPLEKGRCKPVPRWRPILRSRYPVCDGILESMRRTFKKVDYAQVIEPFDAPGRTTLLFFHNLFDACEHHFPHLFSIFPIFFLRFL